MKIMTLLTTIIAIVLLWNLKSVYSVSLLVLGFISGIFFLYGLLISRKTSLSNLIMSLSLFILALVYFFQYLIFDTVKSLLLTALALIFMILVFGRVKVTKSGSRKKINKLSKVYSVEAKAEKTAKTPKNKEKSSSKFVASKSGKKYHVPSCDWAKKISAKNKITFDSEKDAKKKKLKPCACVKG